MLACKKEDVEQAEKQPQTPVTHFISATVDSEFVFATRDIGGNNYVPSSNMVFANLYVNSSGIEGLFFIVFMEPGIHLDDLNYPDTMDAYNVIYETADSLKFWLTSDSISNQLIFLNWEAEVLTGQFEGFMQLNKTGSPISCTDGQFHVKLIL